MFLKYYGLSEQPFGVTPDPRFLYFGEVHREAVASLVYGVEAGLGFASLIAEPGTGKTTLLYYLLGRYRAIARTAFIFDTQCTSRELLRNLMLEFEIDDANDDSVGLLNRLKEFLAIQARARRRVLLVLDEAQNLDSSVLETVRLLSNFETAGSKLLHIILSGQPQLAQKLSEPALLNVRQRITIATRLRPFAPVDVVRYIAHRLNVAGYRGKPLFTPAALEAVARLSGGVPREINRLCFSAMSMGCALERSVIDADIFREVANDFDFSSLLASAPARKSFDMPPGDILEQVFTDALSRAPQIAAAQAAAAKAPEPAPAQRVAPPAAATAVAPPPVPPSQPISTERRPTAALVPPTSHPAKPERKTTPAVAMSHRAGAVPVQRPAAAREGTITTHPATARPAQPGVAMPLQSWIAHDIASRRQHRPALIAAALALLAIAAVAIQLLPPPGAAAAPQPQVTQPAVADNAATAPSAASPRHTRNPQRDKTRQRRPQEQQLPAADEAPPPPGDATATSPPPNHL